MKINLNNLFDKLKASLSQRFQRQPGISEMAPRPDDSARIDYIIKLMRTRSAKLHRRAIALIFIIAGVLIGGIWIFIKAGELTNREMLEDRKKRIELLRTRIKEVDDLIEENKNEVEAKKFKYKTESLNPEFKGQKVTFEEFKEDITSSKEEGDDLKEDRKRLWDLAYNLISSDSTPEGDSGQARTEPTNNRFQLSITISTIATRTGVIVLLLFLVKILVPFYRYSIKLASYYEARADALSLIDLDLIDDTSYKADIGAFERLTLILSPETVGFETPPDTPAEQMIELAKKTLELARNK